MTLMGRGGEALGGAAPVLLLALAGCGGTVKGTSASGLHGAEPDSGSGGMGSVALGDGGSPVGAGGGAPIGAGRGGTGGTGALPAGQGGAIGGDGGALAGSGGVFASSGGVFASSGGVFASSGGAPAGSGGAGQAGLDAGTGGARSPSVDGGVVDADAAPNPCGSIVRHGEIVIQTASDIAALAGVTELDGNLHVQNFTGASLAGLESLLCVANMTVETSPELRSLDGLGSLKQLADLHLMHNPKLASLRALASVHSDLVNLQIEDDPALTSLDGLDGLTSIGFLNLFDSPITSLFPLRHAPPTTVMQISNTALRNFEGMESLVQVASIFFVGNNAQLTSLAGLEALRSTGWFYVVSNHALPNCQAKLLRSRVAANGVEGATILVADNDPNGTCPDAGSGFP